ncbi:MAG: hypothetical protein MJ074_06085 [Oscillospiraceae bacterium]|nr:hypothetical protein [Oscillospiraceae bacterium]
MSLKDQIAADIGRVFMNKAEFADDHMIEGEVVTCVVNEDTTNKIKEGRILGLIEADMVIFGATADMPADRGPESILNVDGREMIVIKWAESMGMSEVALRQNRTM